MSNTLIVCPYGHNSVFIQKQENASWTNHTMYKTVFTCSTCNRQFAVEQHVVTDWVGPSMWDETPVQSTYNQVYEVNGEWRGKSSDFITVKGDNE